MKEYKTLLEEIIENLEKARVAQEDYLLSNAEIEQLMAYIKKLQQKEE